MASALPKNMPPTDTINQAEITIHEIQREDQLNQNKIKKMNPSNLSFDK